MVLDECCRSAIAEGRCLGCQALEDNNFTGNRECIYNRKLTAEESINFIHRTLGMQEKIWK